MNASTAQSEKLVSDLKVVAHDAEDLLKATAHDVGDKARETRARLEEAIERARATCQKLEGKVVAGAKAADQVVREHPYSSIGAALGVGILVGLLIARKK
jgi:ElaB/YqjD/DUF883 family membrane-anchored ribosome-binding protein